MRTLNNADLRLIWAEVCNATAFGYMIFDGAPGILRALDAYGSIIGIGYSKSQKSNSGWLRPSNGCAHLLLGWTTSLRRRQVIGIEA